MKLKTLWLILHAPTNCNAEQTIVQCVCPADTADDMAFHPQVLHSCYMFLCHFCSQFCSGMYPLALSQVWITGIYKCYWDWKKKHIFLLQCQNRHRLCTSSAKDGSIKKNHGRVITTPSFPVVIEEWDFKLMQQRTKFSVWNFQN